MGLDEKDFEAGISLENVKLMQYKVSEESGSSGKDHSLELGSSDERPELMEYDEDIKFYNEQVKSVAQMTPKEREAFILREKEAFFGSPESDDLLGSSSLDKEESYDIHWQRGQGIYPGLSKELDELMEVDEETPPAPKRVPKRGDKSPVFPPSLDSGSYLFILQCFLFYYSLSELVLIN